MFIPSIRLLDGAASLERLVAEAAATGQRAVALTDHGVMYGAFKFLSGGEGRRHQTGDRL